MRREFHTHLIRLGTILVLAACGGAGRDIVEPPPGGGDFVLTVLAQDEDLSIAQTLGWTAGIPSAEVTFTPVDGSGAARNLTTSSAGTVSIPGLQAGKYRVSVRRLLTAGEIAKLNEVSGAGAFVGESEIQVASGSLSGTVKVPASFRTSLVISEWAFQEKFIPGVGSYRYGGFLELYNNSDTTVYLDGVLVADAISNALNAPTQGNGGADCAKNAQYQEDPAGVWAEFIAAFPGTGRDYPLAPGKTVVVATDAIDHRTFFADMLDLRGADFEFIGSADVDNPAVPNMIDRGAREYFFGHGMAWNNVLHEVAAVALSGDPATFVRANVPPNSTLHFRIPRQTILDVFSTISNYYSLQQPPREVCSAIVDRSMDRQYGVFMIDEPDPYLVSFSRKVLRTLPDGRHILQSTRNSANDFQRTPRTPGFVTQ